MQQYLSIRMKIYIQTLHNLLLLNKLQPNRVYFRMHSVNVAITFNYSELDPVVAFFVNCLSIFKAKTIQPSLYPPTLCSC